MNSGTSKAFDGPVLSIAKLRVGQEAYQLSGVAQSLDDYYTGAGEASGQWAGVGAERLGLMGEVAADEMLNPVQHNPERLAASHARNRAERCHAHGPRRRSR